MRVLILLREFYCPSLPIGGAERQALKLAGELDRLGISVTIVTGLWEWHQPRREVIQGISVHRHFTAWGLFGIRGLRKFGFYSYVLSLYWYLLLHRNDYDLIHCHSALVEVAYAVLAAQWLNKPSLIRPMGSGAFGDYKRLSESHSLFGQNWLVSILCQANAIVAVNPQIIDEMVSMGMVKERIVSISNGVEIVPEHLWRDYSLHEMIRIVFVGRLHPVKGIDTLLKAFKRIMRERPDHSWRLQLAGTGPLKLKLQAIANELEIDHCVEFLGHINHVDTILDQADCFVLPSVSEGMSNALLEAMARGLPCVATNVPGNNSLIQHQHNGLLVPPNDDKALADAIIVLVMNDEMREKFGREAFKTIKDNYSLNYVARQYIALYKDLLRNKAE